MLSGLCSQPCRVGYRDTLMCPSRLISLLTALAFHVPKTRRKSARFRVGTCPYPVITAGHSFSVPAARIAVFLAVHLPMRQRYGFTEVPLSHARGSGPGSVSSTPGSLRPCAPIAREQPDPYLWFGPVSIFGLLPITVFISSSRVLTLLTSLALPPPLMLAAR